MATRIFLGAMALIWGGFGLYGLLNPGFLADTAGVASSTPSGTTELRAVYGGMTASVGALCAAALLRENLVRPALFALVVLTTGLFLGRLIGAMMDASWTGYTLVALAMELGGAVLARIMLLRS